MEHTFDREERKEWFKAVKLEMMPKKVFFPPDLCEHIYGFFETEKK